MYLASLIKEIVMMPGQAYQNLRLRLRAAPGRHGNPPASAPTVEDPGPRISDLMARRS
jgi:hypothetical protein